MNTISENNEEGKNKKEAANHLFALFAKDMIKGLLMVIVIITIAASIIFYLKPTIIEILIIAIIMAAIGAYSIEKVLK